MIANGPFSVRHVLAVVLSLTCTPPVAAQITDTNQFFKALCVGDKSTGFNWRNKNWEEARFKPDKYLAWIPTDRN